MTKGARSQNLVQSTRKAIQAIVRIRARGFNEANIASALDPRFAEPEEWTGSGFFIELDGKEGFLLTNAHVARNADDLEIYSPITSDEAFKVEVVGLVENMVPDVALLRLPPDEVKRFKKYSGQNSIPSLKPADSLEVERGEEIKAIGYPLGLEEPNVTGGEISNFISGHKRQTEHFVTDAAINPGNSGGPALMANGLVIGLNTAIYVDASNIGFITPMHVALRAVSQILEGKKVGLCFLGATLQKNSVLNSLFLGQKEPSGVIICQVEKGGLAWNAKLKPMDVLLEINGFALDRHGNVQKSNSRRRTLFDVLHSVPIGHDVSFKVIRKKKILILKGTACLQTASSISSQPILRKRSLVCFGGLVVQEVCLEILSALAAQEGRDMTMPREEELVSKVIVTHICKGMQAEELGLSVGDYVTNISGNRVRNLIDVEKAVTKLRKSGQELAQIVMASGAFGILDLRLFDDEQGHIIKFGESARPK